MTHFHAPLASCVSPSFIAFPPACLPLLSSLLPSSVNTPQTCQVLVIIRRTRKSLELILESEVVWCAVLLLHTWTSLAKWRVRCGELKPVKNEEIRLITPCVLMPSEHECP